MEDGYRVATLNGVCLKARAVIPYMKNKAVEWWRAGPLSEDTRVQQVLSLMWHPGVPLDLLVKALL